MASSPFDFNRFRVRRPGQRIGGQVARRQYPTGATHVWHFEEAAAGPFADAVTADPDFALSALGDFFSKITGPSGQALAGSTGGPNIVYQAGPPFMENSAQDFTVLGWFKQVDPGAAYGSAFLQVATEDLSLALIAADTSVGGGDGPFNFSIHPSPGDDAISAVPVPPDWFAFALVYEHAELRAHLYINGQLATTLEGLEAPATGWAFLVIGDANGDLENDSWAWDEVATFERALLPAEIAKAAQFFYEGA